jgi:hypothetical protein
MQNKISPFIKLLHLKSCRHHPAFIENISTMGEKKSSMLPVFLAIVSCLGDTAEHS